LAWECVEAAVVIKGEYLFRRAENLIKTVMMTLGLALLVSCSSTSGGVFTGFFMPKGNRLDWSQFALKAAEGANLNTALAVDLVLVEDDVMMSTLLTMPSFKWFSTRADLVKSFPEKLRYLSIEVAPTQIIGLPRDGIGYDRVIGAIVFADYQTPGEHRLRVDQLKGDVLIELGPRSFAAITPQNR